MNRQRLTVYIGTLLLVLLLGLWGQLSLQAQLPESPGGTIAYFKDQTELHLVNPDGSNDRTIWTNPKPMSPFFSATIDWRPDGGELAFQSGHDLLCSSYADDIWAIAPDGSNRRRVTNAPDCATLAARPQGSVSVTILNENLTYSTYFLYVEGALEAQSFVLGPGLQQTITLDNVADYGAGVQQVVTVYSGDNLRSWIHGAGADVQPGQTVQVSGVLGLDDGVPRFTAEQPAYRRDGAQIAFLLGGGMPRVISATPGEADRGTALTFDGQVPLSYIDFSPVSDHLLGLFFDGITSHFLRIDTQSGHVDTLFDDDSGVIMGLSWLPDGSGFVYGITGNFGATANLFRYDIGSGTKHQITHFSDGTAASDPSVSPDGGWIAFTKQDDDPNTPLEVWVVKMDGSDSWMIADNAAFPAWGPDALTPTPPTETPTTTPTLPAATPTPIETPPPGSERFLYLPYTSRN